MATANDFQFDLLALTIFGHECKLWSTFNAVSSILQLFHSY